MAYDETLAERARELMLAREGVVERKMFGGIAWMLHGNMATGVLGEDLIVRLDKEDMAQALAEGGAGVFRFQPAGRPMSGFVCVGPELTADDAELARWIDCGAGYAASLPPK